MISLTLLNYLPQKIESKIIWHLGWATLQSNQADRMERIIDKPVNWQTIVHLCRNRSQYHMIEFERLKLEMENSIDKDCENSHY